MLKLHKWFGIQVEGNFFLFNHFLGGIFLAIRLLFQPQFLNLNSKDNIGSQITFANGNFSHFKICYNKRNWMLMLMQGLLIKVRRGLFVINLTYAYQFEVCTKISIHITIPYLQESQVRNLNIRLIHVAKVDIHLVPA